MRHLTTALATIVVGIALTVTGAAVGTPADRALTGEQAETSEAQGQHRRCAQEFDRVARLDMESFRDYDAETWRELHHPDAETVFASGQRFVGVEAIMRALGGHFSGREAIFSWTELSRYLDPTCTLGMVVYETRYQLPSVGFDQRTTTAVTFVRERGEWLVLYDQGTELP